MVFAKPENSRARVDDAGQHLAELIARDDPPDDPERIDKAFDTIDNWRASHAYPLQVLKMTLRGRARRIDHKALVAQRLKRLASIGTKLVLNPNMKLSQMQDIGGCRAVLPVIGDVDNVAAIYTESVVKNPKDRPEFVKKYDYIASPKPDGYRGVHLVYKYRTGSNHLAVYNGHRIEIQIRSRLQHVWATAVEIASTFTGKALKSSGGDAEWRRFFALMGSALAKRERRPIVPGTPEDQAELVRELKRLSTRLNVVPLFETWGTAVQPLISETQGANQFLMELNPIAKEIEVRGYTSEQSSKARQDYIEAEKRTVGQRDIQVVLVSVDSLEALPRAYPNYYVDTRAFLRELQNVIGLRPKRGAPKRARIGRKK